MVAHLSKESLPIEQTRRQVTVYLEASPGDSLRGARDHFREYVKPVLVAASLDYNIIEGRMQGDIRAKTAERIRKSRRRAGEPRTAEEEYVVEDVIDEARAKMGVVEEPGPKGDLVIGRHTWREYIRGLHEGWLGPIDPPTPPAPAIEKTAATPSGGSGMDAKESKDTLPESESSEAKESPENKDKPEENPETPKPSGPTLAYIAPSDYSSQNLPRTMPELFETSAPLPFPVLLGFLNFPIRLYRYLRKRYLAEEVGREVAAFVLASSERPYRDERASGDSGFDPSKAKSGVSSQTYEQQSVLKHEEKDWPKWVHTRDQEDKEREREWLDDVVVDPRIGSRMQRSTLSPEEEARSRRIANGEEYIFGEERPTHFPFWKRVWISYGYGEDEETLRKKPIIGNLDGED